MSDENNTTDTSEQGTDLQFPLKVTPQPPDENGNVQVHLEYGPEFRDWFMEREGLKRWSEKRFEKVMKPLIEEYFRSNQPQQEGAQQPTTDPVTE